MVWGGGIDVRSIHSFRIHLVERKKIDIAHRQINRMKSAIAGPTFLLAGATFNSIL